MIISDYLTLVRECQYYYRVDDLVMRECLIIYVVVAPHPTSNIKERACVRLSVNIIQVSQVFLPPVQCYSPATA